jgi:phage tail-like protein
MGLSETFDSTGIFKFGFSIDGMPTKNVKSVDGLNLKMDNVQTKTNDALGRPIHKVFAGNKQYLGSMTVTRLMTEDLTWYEWFEKALSNTVEARLPASVIITDARKVDMPVVRTYNFINCLPTELKVTGMNAANANAVEETIVIMYENMTIVPGGG